ncbi:MAG TPA: glycerol-3-phosphate 1-O-acyltransferase PlsY [Xanthobacteraceae bacterium]|nr:glycerol-3-phosphate 1-O-acyltransferase PlsY [Xanthobacteraceae bacterium]
MTPIETVAALALGYLLGSVPFGLIFTQLAGTTDIRQIGSGSIGATNVLRTGRIGLAAVTLIADVLKGTAAVLLMMWWSGHDAGLVAGLGAFLGHLFPIWLKFKGGKGIATGLGILLAVSWKAALVIAAIWLVVAAATRYSSLSSLVASLAAPVVVWFIGTPHEALLFLALAILTFIMHRGNIARLISGTEGKIGEKAAPKPSA